VQHRTRRSGTVVVSAMTFQKWYEFVTVGVEDCDVVCAFEGRMCEEA
jgi:hypothetical protein